jgi:hypothetical protein
LLPVTWPPSFVSPVGGGEAVGGEALPDDPPDEGVEAPRDDQYAGLLGLSWFEWLFAFALELLPCPFMSVLSFCAR